MQMCDVVMLSDVKMSQNERRGYGRGTSQAVLFCGREELPLALTLGFLTFKSFYMHKNS